jgi:hypothetical protein
MKENTHKAAFLALAISVLSNYAFHSSRTCLRTTWVTNSKADPSAQESASLQSPTGDHEVSGPESAAWGLHTADGFTLHRVCLQWLPCQNSSVPSPQSFRQIFLSLLIDTGTQTELVTGMTNNSVIPMKQLATFKVNSFC